MDKKTQESLRYMKSWEENQTINMSNEKTRLPQTES